MKTQDKKQEFILYRVQGLSYAKICKKLDICKSTCSKWEQELKSQIEAGKSEAEQELYTSYKMGKEARIERLAGTLEQINEALANKPLDDVPADKLLKLKLEYERELKAEYTPPAPEPPEQTIDGVLKAYAELYVDSQTGRLTPNQIKTQLAVLEGTLRAVNQKANNVLLGGI